MSAPLPVCSCASGRHTASCPRHGISKDAWKERAPKAAATKRRTRLKPVSDKQEILNEYLRGVREGFIFLQNRLDPEGARCWNCGRKARRLELHHVIHRSAGGHHTPSNLELWCAGTKGSCHSVEHGEPEWSHSRHTTEVES